MDETAHGEKVGDVPPLIWTRLTPTGRGRQPGLTHQQIAQASVEIADAEGLDAVTMRRVATTLGTGTMSLYRYVVSRDDIVELMVDQVISELSLDGRAGDGWRDVLIELAHVTRRLTHRHPWLVGYALGTRPPLGPHTLAWIETSTALLEVEGLHIDQVMDLGATVSAFVAGFVQAELTDQEQQRRTGLNEEQWRARSGPYLMSILETGRYPRMKRIVADADDFPDADINFQRRLNYIVNGLGAGLGLT
jgi:AcrR family transcriptional regulator